MWEMATGVPPWPEYAKLEPRDLLVMVALLALSYPVPNSCFELFLN